MRDNRTYSAKHPENDMHDAHAKATGLSHVELGFGQDLIVYSAGVAKWVGILTGSLRFLLGNVSLYIRREGCANDN